MWVSGPLLWVLPPPPYVRENGVIRDEKMGTEVTDLGCGGQVLAEPGL